MSYFFFIFKCIKIIIVFKGKVNVVMIENMMRLFFVVDDLVFIIDVVKL